MVVSAAVLNDLPELFTSKIVPNSMTSTNPGQRVMGVAEWYTLGSLSLSSRSDETYNNYYGNYDSYHVLIISYIIYIISHLSLVS